MDSGSTLTEFERGMVIGCIRAGKQVKDIIKAGGLPKAAALKFAADVEKGIVDIETGLYKSTRIEDLEPKENTGSKMEKTTT
ncbi:hypothetical protein EOD39_17470 [Acipenser ruthenus]|uniref:Uncharacterized protein n=1 Tax=Acipenser ruthenus TaxID=7906 RepID=A0A444V3C1_ACIRT|nr:hypothetical protein EOD39_17470 [Acipenser ruthenus]